MEGPAANRLAVIEFKDYETALACYRSPEYQAARPLRLAHSAGDFVIVEGYDGAQPPSSDSPFAKPAPKSLRRKSGRKPGGQPGIRVRRWRWSTARTSGAGTSPARAPGAAQAW